MEHWFIPNAPASLPPADSVLIMAPHPDDEVFGCAGCAALYARAGAKVTPFILTDGGGHLAGEQRQHVMQTRHAESTRAAATLGTQAPQFGPWADRQLSSVTDLAEHLAAMIERTQAQMVFAPSPWEVHPDHRATAWATVMALQNRLQSGQTVPDLAFYEVGAPLRPTHLIDITPVFDAKKQAMACFPSQLGQQRYDVHIAALNTFRTYTLPGTTLAAEALAIVPPHALQAFASAYGEQAPPGLAMVTEAALQRADTLAEQMQARAAEQDQALAQHQHHAAELQAALLAQERHAAEQRLAHQHHAAELQAALLAQERQVAELQATLQRMLASRSWRITRPLRWLAQRLR